MIRRRTSVAPLSIAKVQPESPKPLEDFLAITNEVAGNTPALRILKLMRHRHYFDELRPAAPWHVDFAVAGRNSNKLRFLMNLGDPGMTTRFAEEGAVINPFKQFNHPAPDQIVQAEPGVVYLMAPGQTLHASPELSVEPVQARGELITQFVNWEK
jgi:hypothetical protein